MKLIDEGNGVDFFWFDQKLTLPLICIVKNVGMEISFISPGVILHFMGM